MDENAIINEMIEMLFVKRFRKRLKYDFIDKGKEREDRYFRYSNGDYFDSSLIIERVDSMSEEYILRRLKEEGAHKSCFLIGWHKSGIFRLKEGLYKAYLGGFALLYCGNGVGYFQGEYHAVGAPDRWILVNKKKKGQENLFD